MSPQASPRAPELRLVQPARLYESSFLTALNEMSEADQRSWLYMPIDPEEARSDFGAYIDRMLWLNDNPPAHFVRGEVLWAIWNSEIVGRIGIRHVLNENLANVGGHIGYIVRPSARRQGVASEMLRQALLTSSVQQIEKVLVTCAADNVASLRTIEKNGGVFSRIYELGEGRPAKRHYWINVTKVPTLHSARLTLTRLEAKHARQMWNYAKDPEVAKTVTWEAHKTEADSLAFIAYVNQKLLSQRPGKNFIVWGIQHNESGEIIGTIQAAQSDDELAQIDFALSRAYWKQGLMTEAASVVRDWVFRSLPSVKRIRSFCIAENIGSRRVMEKIGLQLDRVENEAMPLKGRLVNLAHYSIARNSI